ncbi:MAG TPA: menaquinone biosynthesis protein [Bryobacteraceae bacterium]|nr:menaquinone biosynthesis protein [Bryobacteraceae bacterium]
MKQDTSRFHVGAVSYLNTVPLIWGMAYGPERDAIDLTFSIPSECAQQLEQDRIDVGLVPVAEIARQGLEIISDVGITCFGPVRSILLFSRVPWRSIRTLAADASSRTSVQLARVILSECFGITPVIHEHVPMLTDMLAESDAALVIGDPALRLDPEQLPYNWLDLGSEWTKLTGLPMVFAAWAGKSTNEPLSGILRRSYEFGRHRIDEIARQEYEHRGVSCELAKRYLTEYIRFEIGPKEREGLRTFLTMANLGKADHVLATTTI